MDMGFALQDRVYRLARAVGYPDLFDGKDYIYLGRKKQGGYEYEPQKNEDMEHEEIER